jgi:hypothetical protein
MRIVNSISEAQIGKNSLLKLLKELRCIKILKRFINMRSMLRNIWMDRQAQGWRATMGALDGM